MIFFLLIQQEPSLLLQQGHVHTCFSLKPSSTRSVQIHFSVAYLLLEGGQLIISPGGICTQKPRLLQFNQSSYYKFHLFFGNISSYILEHIIMSWVNSHHSYGASRSLFLLGDFSSHVWSISLISFFTLPIIFILNFIFLFIRFIHRMNSLIYKYNFLYIIIVTTYKSTLKCKYAKITNTHRIHEF